MKKLKTSRINLKKIPVYVCDGKASTGKLPTFMKIDLPADYLKEYKTGKHEFEKILEA